MTNIILCAQDMIDQFPEGLERFLELVECEGALVTDESTLWDFSVDIKQRNRLNLALGYVADDNTYVWKLARDLEKK